MAVRPIIWHNPRCSKSRQTLALLTDAGLDPVVIFYKVDVPTRDELIHALELLEIDAADFIRKRETIYKELNLKDADNDSLIDAMVAHPELIERPVVFANGKAVIGRPPETVKDIL